MYFIVLRISYVFLCFCDVCILLFFYMELFEYWISINITDFNCNKRKYCILELKMEFWHKKPFSIRFVHKSRKFSIFELTDDYIMLRNFQTVRPIFPKIAPKVAQDFKEKSHESSRRGNFFPRNYRAKCRGGGAESAPPPPPPPPGPFRVKVIVKLFHQLTPGVVSGETRARLPQVVRGGGGGGAFHQAFCQCFSLTNLLLANQMQGFQ